LLSWYKEAQKQFRAGNLLVEFPPWTYGPPLAAPEYLQPNLSLLPFQQLGSNGFGGLHSNQ
jgi:hypothetical protein